ncbi:PDZ domain-containing protein [Sulfurimonas sp. HSL-1716]|uniref:DUF7488 domain-containing protein n=1 Tax=Hydrocurvibacter sulfurireducens TaxID=3131937 RepID=UPI0031F7D1EC
MRYFFLFLFTLTPLLASCKGGYFSCEQKIKDSHSIVNNSLYIPVSKTQRLVFSESLPVGNIIKADKFLGLYLISGLEGFRYPFKISTHLPSGLAVVDDKMALEGKITAAQLGLDSLAKFSEVPFVPSFLSSSCCNLEGLVTSRGIIQKSYLSHFLNTKSSDYGDIGIRIDEKRCITKIDPFLKGNPFHVADIVVEFDGKKIASAERFMQNILFAKIGSLHKIKILRDKKSLNFDVKIYKRFGGGLISDTFLEQKGFYFNDDLTLKSVVGYGLKKGDELLSINGNKIGSLDDIPAAIGTKTEDMVFLFQRDGFQFFVHIN